MADETKYVYTFAEGSRDATDLLGGKRTSAAAFRIAHQLIDEQLISHDEGLARVKGSDLSQLMFPQFDARAGRTVLVTGMAASPGAAGGKVVFDSPTAVAWAARGEEVILVRRSRARRGRRVSRLSGNRLVPRPPSAGYRPSGRYPALGGTPTPTP